MCKIKIVDAPCGAGKTSWAIQLINNSPKSIKFIYVTPFLSEIDRIVEECSSKKFVTPKNLGDGKLDQLYKLLKQGKNIATTHVLFSMVDDNIKDLLASRGYFLILDEVMNVIEHKPLKKDDVETMLKADLIDIAEDGLVTWHEDKMDYESQYNFVKEMCKNKSLYRIDNNYFAWTFPVEIFKSFVSVTILTYMFDGQIQRYYFDMFDVEYEYKSVKHEDDKYFLTDYVQDTISDKYKDYVRFVDEKDKINALGERTNTYSSTWYKKADKSVIEVVRKNLINFHKNKAKNMLLEDDTVNLIYSVYQSEENKAIFQKKGYVNNLVACNTRATNKYKEANTCAYLCNIYLNPEIKKFFIQHNVDVNEDIYALSELIQWIFRSRIREKEEIRKPIAVYIPSKRMRKLFQQWLNDEINYRERS